MPLIPRDGGPTHRIEITPEIDPAGVGDWYEIKTQLGYYDRMQASDMRGGSIRMPAHRVTQAQDLGPDELVTLTMDNVAEATHIKLCVWLKAWSHPDHMTSATIRRIPESHARAILKAIDRYEQHQGGPAKDSPLPQGSNGLSVISSSTREHQGEPVAQ